jgi:hypothetical protein
MRWHYRLGHPSFAYLKTLFPEKFKDLNITTLQCEICQFAKITKSVYAKVPYLKSHPFHLIHSDVWGPSRVKHVTGARWFVTFIDDHSRVTWLFLMKDKSEVGAVFQTFYNMVSTQFSTKIKILKTDNAKEYFESNLCCFLKDRGIIHISSCVETPQQNGIA